MDRQLALLKVGSTFDRINVAEVKNLLVAIPPPEEQQLIASVLDERISVSERAKNRSRSEQDLIQEFRARLIADVVTGKVDVREASVALAEVDDPRFHSDEVDQDPIPDIDDDDRMQSGDRDDDHDRDDPEES
jgi:type I restriction enzyme S subunit